jgi:hypothetical protein
MKNPNTIEEELNKTRERLYEETKNMTAEEHVAYIKSLATPILKEYGLRTLNQIEAEGEREKEAVLFEMSL